MRVVVKLQNLLHDSIFWGPFIPGLLILSQVYKHLDWTGLSLDVSRGILSGEELCLFNACCVQRPEIGNLTFNVLLHTLKVYIPLP